MLIHNPHFQSVARLYIYSWIDNVHKWTIRLKTSRCNRLSQQFCNSRFINTRGKMILFLIEEDLWILVYQFCHDIESFQRDLVQGILNMRLCSSLMSILTTWVLWSLRHIDWRTSLSFWTRICQIFESRSWYYLLSQLVEKNVTLSVKIIFRFSLSGQFILFCN